MVEQHQPDSTLEMTAFLEELFRFHGVETVRDEEWILFPGRDVRAQAAIVRESPDPTRIWVQLDVRFVIGPGRALVESCGGMGTTRAGAVADAQSCFMRNSFHAILAAFLSSGGDHARREEWVIDGEARPVIHSDIASRGSVPKGRDAVAWLERLQETLRTKSVGGGTHWIRLYYAHAQREALVCEVLRDNDVWHEVQAEMSAIDWPASDDFYSVRFFMVVQGGVGVGETIAAICEHPEQDDETLVEALIGRGATQLEAEKLIDLVPLAFGREFLEFLPVRLSDHATVCRPGSSQVRQIRLEEELIFAEALRIARGVARRGLLTETQHTALVSRSPEVGAVKQMLDGGSRPENVLLGPTALFWSESADRCSAPPLPVKPKPWWKRWK